jgi:lysophospholipase L1-like esterase
MPTLITYVIIVLVSLVTLEVGSFGILTWMDMSAGLTLEQAIHNRERESPWLANIRTYNEFDPVTLTRMRIGEDRGGRIVNRFGFVDNGHQTAPFPEKSAGLFRIAVFGGSSLEGQGLTGAQTIPAQLESILSESRKFQQVQVLNFGMTGAYTWSSVVRYLSEVTFYDPDAVICLEGWNDAILARFEAPRRGVPHAIVDWGQPAYEYFDFWHGLPAIAVSAATAPSIMTWSYVLAKHLAAPASRSAEKAMIYGDSPSYRFSGDVTKADPNFSQAFASNLDAIGQHARAHGRLFLAYLQPHAEYGKPLSSEEDVKISDFLAAASHDYGPEWQRRTYDKIMREAFSDYAASVKSIEGAQDIRELFADRPETLYQDAIHYNVAGAHVIAERMAADLLALRNRQR